MPEEATMAYRIGELEKRVDGMMSSLNTLNTAVATGMQSITAQISALQIQLPERFTPRRDFDQHVERGDMAHARLEELIKDERNRADGIIQRIDQRSDMNNERIERIENRTWQLVVAILTSFAALGVALIALMDKVHP